MNNHNSQAPDYCYRCNNSGFIPFFRVRTLKRSGREYRSGSSAVARCSCSAGHALSDEISFYDHGAAFANQPHTTLFEYGWAALLAENSYLRKVVWPNLCRQLEKVAEHRPLKKQEHWQLYHLRLALSKQDRVR